MDPAEGERSAVVGLTGQYNLAARIVVSQLPTLNWIRVADPMAGIADDFQFEAGTTRHAIQVKFAQYPGSFIWSRLISSGADGSSLIGELAKAWIAIRSDWTGPLVIHLWTNEYASSSTPPSGTPLAQCQATGPKHFAAFIHRSYYPVQRALRAGSDAVVEIESLPDARAWVPAWVALRNATGLDGPNFLAFVATLELAFGIADQNDLFGHEGDPSQSDVRHVAALLQRLVADRSRPVQLDRAELLERLGWTDRLRYRNPHTFPIPTIYVANAAARDQLQRRLEELSGGYVALVGPAGSGKSTLLSSLQWPGERVARYYAFVPDSPDPISARGEAESFLHDLTLALERGGLPRGGYGLDTRSQRLVLHHQLERAGERFRMHGQRTVVVVDGLDHVPREQTPSRSMIEELPAPSALPPGVFFVLGTQIASILPAAIRETLEVDERTVELPLWPLRACCRSLMRPDRGDGCCQVNAIG